MLPDVSRESFAHETGLSNVSRESLDKLTHYLALLEKWQRAVNLVSPSTLPDAWNRHFVDSAQLGALLDEEKTVLFDFGSGAGFPGMALAILYPQLAVHLVESDQKKCSFLSTV
jgi:16S rRNA (guanine527-N7)-methyltransferase